MTSEYYWIDTKDYAACGSFDTAAEAQEGAADFSEVNGEAHKHDILIVKLVSRSPAPSLKRKFKVVL